MNNKKNLQYFENKTMRGLDEDMQTWQEDNQKRLLSTEIMKDGDMFACIALTNPTEVVICNTAGEPLCLYSSGGSWGQDWCLGVRAI